MDLEELIQTLCDVDAQDYLDDGHISSFFDYIAASDIDISSLSEDEALKMFNEYYAGDGNSLSFEGRGGMSDRDYRNALDAADKMEREGNRYGAEKLRSEAVEAKRSGVGARSVLDKTWDMNHKR